MVENEPQPTVDILNLSEWGNFYLIRLFDDLRNLEFAKSYQGNIYNTQDGLLTKKEMISLSGRAVVSDFSALGIEDGEKGLEAGRATISMNRRLDAA